MNSNTHQPSPTVEPTVDPFLGHLLRPSANTALIAGTTMPWWEHLLPGNQASVAVPTPEAESVSKCSSIMDTKAVHPTAEQMFRAFVDPYTAYRHVPSKASSAPAALASFITPPANSVHAVDHYDDNALAFPPPVLPSVQSMMFGAEIAAEDDAAMITLNNTPTELIEAAVFALMASSTAQPSPSSTSIQPQQHQQHYFDTQTSNGYKFDTDMPFLDSGGWSLPASATFGSFPITEECSAISDVQQQQHCSLHNTFEFPPVSQSSRIGPIRVRSNTVNSHVTTAIPFDSPNLWLDSNQRTRSPTISNTACPDYMTVDGQFAHAGASDGGHRCLWMGCSQVYPNANALTQHVNRVHIARRQPAHRCLWTGCNRANHVFRHRDKILIHIRLHTNDRPFQCDMCDKQFSRSDSLEAHKKIHSAEGKSWHCRVPGCNRTYYHAKSLKKHEKTMHGIDWDLAMDNDSPKKSELEL